MKKVLLGLSGVIIVAFMIVLVANAQPDSQEIKKSETEVAKDCGKCPSAATCIKAEAVKKCDNVKCGEGKCENGVCTHKEHKSQGDVKECTTSGCGGCRKK